MLHAFVSSLLIFTFALSASAQDTRRSPKNVAGVVADRPSPPKAQVFRVDGMHCKACVASLEKVICEEGLYESCAVNLIDAKAQLGQVRIVPKTGQILKVSELRDKAASAGDYKLSRDRR